MIKIDDLLKQRLGDAEERERAGAWTNMRDLLDQQMPVAAGASTNWRRMLAYVAGILVLATATVGGYQAVNSFSGNNGTEKMAMNSSRSTDTYSGIIANAINNLPDGATATTADKEQASNVEQHAPVQKTVVNNSSAAKAATTVATNKPLSASKAQPESIIQSSGSTNKPAKNSMPIAATTPQKTKDNAPAKAAQTASEQNDNVASNNSVNNTIDNSQNNQPQNNSNDPNKISREKDELGQMGTADQQLLAKNDIEEPEFEVERRPYKKYEVKGRVNENGEYEKDTFNISDEEKVDLVVKNESKPVPADMNDEATSSEEDNNGSSILPSSPAQPSSLADNNSTAGENNGNVNSKAGKNRYRNPKRFEEMVQGAKVRLGRMKFYPGIIAGANTAFSKTNISGFQVGLASKLTIDERWGILTEAKYVYRFNGRERLQDDYITNVKNAAIGGQSVITYDSVEHYYNFNNYSSVELPIALSYNFNKRIYAFGGVNLTYNFKINNLQEVELIHTQEAGATSTNVNIAATDKSILLSDFKPSFGVGYVGGIGWQPTNKFSFDLRLTQPILMKNNTLGQEQISDRLYKMPNMQLNMTFRLGGNKFKPYKKN